MHYCEVLGALRSAKKLHFFSIQPDTGAQMKTDSLITDRQIKTSKTH